VESSEILWAFASPSIVIEVAEAAEAGKRLRHDLLSPTETGLQPATKRRLYRQTIYFTSLEDIKRRA
jgi:hypothetical protein